MLAFPCHRAPRRRSRLLPVLLVLAALAPLAALPRAHSADYPGYSLEETIVEYDVDPTWPRRPADVRPFGWVSGMAIDGRDQVWVFGKGPNPVQVYRPDGTFLRAWSTTEFVDPHHLRLDPEGNVWVADFGRHIVQKFTPEGKLLLTLGTLGVAGEDRTHFNRPTDMAITPAGDVFVTDGYGNRRVVQFDRNGRFVRAWGTYGTRPGQFVLPHAIVVDSKGRLYVADRNSGRIQVFDQQGRVLDVWSNLIMPWGLHITPKDEIWVCGSSPHWWYRRGEYPEFKDQVLMRLSTDGRVRQVWGLPLGQRGKTKPGETSGVHCIVQDSKGAVYIGDIYGERAQRLVPVRERSAAERHVRVALVGDSTVASYPKPPADRPDLAGWGQLFGELFTPRVQVSNQAVSGRSARSFLREERWEPVLASRPEFVFIQFGHNDQKTDGDRRADPREFAELLRRYLRDARQAGARPVLVTPVARRTFRDGTLTDSLEPWAEAMKSVGKAEGVAVIDLHAASMALYRRLGDAGSAAFSPSAADRTHFSMHGAQEMAKLVAAAVRAQVPELAAHLRPEAPAPR